MGWGDGSWLGPALHPEQSALETLRSYTADLQRAQGERCVLGPALERGRHPHPSPLTPRRIFDPSRERGWDSSPTFGDWVMQRSHQGRGEGTPPGIHSLFDWLGVSGYLPHLLDSGSRAGMTIVRRYRQARGERGVRRRCHRTVFAFGKRPAEICGSPPGRTRATLWG